MLYSRHEIRHSPAFSLIELTMVIMVIGLLVGGIMAGQSMVRNSELQIVMTDVTKYQSAVDDFKKQYKAIPGDMIDATEYWDVSTACSGAAANGTCNGDGDGILDDPSGAGASGEPYQFWRQLTLAGRISGNYSGTAGAGGAFHAVGGTNVPKGVFKTSTWETYYLSPTYAGDALTYSNANYNNYLRFGASTTNGPNSGAILSPGDAKKIDEKMDDGKPAMGRTIAGRWDDCTDSATRNGSQANKYLLATGTPACTLYFVNQF